MIINKENNSLHLNMALRTNLQIMYDVIMYGRIINVSEIGLYVLSEARII